MAPVNPSPEDCQRRGYQVLLASAGHSIWWRLMTGAVVQVPWPASESSSDPNVLYRPFLEANIGRQGWDWQWDMSAKGWGIDIKLRRGKVEWAPILLLKWAGQ